MCCFYVQNGRKKTECKRLLTKLRSWNWLLAGHQRETVHDVMFRSKRSTFLRWLLAQRHHSHWSKHHYDWWHDDWSNGYGWTCPMNPMNGHWFWHGSLEYDCYSDYSFFVSLCHNNWMTYYAIISLGNVLVCYSCVMKIQRKVDKSKIPLPDKYDALKRSWCCFFLFILLSFTASLYQTEFAIAIVVYTIVVVSLDAMVSPLRKCVNMYVLDYNCIVSRLPYGPYEQMKNERKKHRIHRESFIFPNIQLK